MGVVSNIHRNKDKENYNIVGAESIQRFDLLIKYVCSLTLNFIKQTYLS
jgi:hypothetical protein